MISEFWHKRFLTKNIITFNNLKFSSNSINRSFSQLPKALISIPLIEEGKKKLLIVDIAKAFESINSSSESDGISTY